MCLCACLRISVRSCVKFNPITGHSEQVNFPASVKNKKARALDLSNVDPDR